MKPQRLPKNDSNSQSHTKGVFLGSDIRRTRVDTRIVWTKWYQEENRVCLLTTSMFGIYMSVYYQYDDVVSRGLQLITSKYYLCTGSGRHSQQPNYFSVVRTLSSSQTKLWQANKMTPKKQQVLTIQTPCPTGHLAPVSLIDVRNPSWQI
jgi:hypothetical protein